MSRGYYSVIRYIPDPARGETFNVGILVWNGAGFKVSVDEGAARRAIKENPLLARDALRGLDSAIRSQIKRLGDLTYEKFEALCADQPGIPFVFAEPCSVAIAESGLDPIRDTLQRLLDRVVRPRPTETTAKRGPKEPLLAALSPLIQRGKVELNRRLQGGVTRQRRLVDFFVSGDAGVALDVLSLERRGEESIGERADAEAYKVYDLKKNKILKDYYILCLFSPQEVKDRANEFARQTLESAGGRVVTKTQEAAHVMERAAG